MRSVNCIPFLLASSFACIEMKSICLLLPREHEWFKKDLPNYLFPSPNDQDASIVDLEVIREICEVSLIFSLKSAIKRVS